MTHSLFLGALRAACGLLMLLWAPVAMAADAQTLSLAEAVARALERAPAVRVAQSAAQQAATEPGVAAMWPNPQLTAGSNVNSARGYANLLFPLPILGQRGAAIHLAEAVSAVGAQAQQVTRNDTALGTRVAWLDLWQAEQEAATLERTRQRRQRLLDMTQARWEAGSSAQLEVFRARTELARATAEATAALALVEGKAAYLAAWLLPEDTSLPLRTQGEPNTPETPAPPLMLDAHPQMRQAGAVLHVAEDQVLLEKALRWPTLGVELGVNAWSPSAPDRDGHVALTFEVPLFNLREPLIDRASAAQLRAAAENQQVAVRLRADAVATERALTAAAVRAHAQVTSILPAAKQAADLALEGYRDGAFDINSVLLAEQSLADAQIETFRALADHGKAWAARQHALGVVP